MEKDTTSIYLGLLNVCLLLAKFSIYSNTLDILENALKWRCATYLTHVRKAVFLSYPVRGVAVGHLHGPVISEYLPVAQGE